MLTLLSGIRSLIISKKKMLLKFFYGQKIMHKKTIICFTITETTKFHDFAMRLVDIYFLDVFIFLLIRLLK